MSRRDSRFEGDTDEPFVAHVYGNTPPDFAAIAASGFEVVAMDSLAPWFGQDMIVKATAHGLIAFGHPMSVSGLKPTRYQQTELRVQRR